MFPMSMDTENHVFTGGELKKKKKSGFVSLLPIAPFIDKYPSNT